MTMPTPERMGLADVVETNLIARLETTMDVRTIGVLVLITGVLLGSRWLKKHHLTVGQVVNLMVRSNKDTQ